MGRRFFIALMVAALAIPIAAVAPAAATGADLLPDLRMGQIYNPYLTTTRHGNKRLRFGTIVYNEGDGPIEIHANHRNGKVMGKVFQWIKRDDGSAHGVLKPDARVFFAGDGHDHWHVARFNVVRINPLPGTPSSSERRLRKIGFCLVDTLKMSEPRPPNSPPQPTFFGCGEADSSSVRIGIDVGWGDVYSPEIRFQVIDVTDLPAGEYRICATVNPRHIWTEKNDNFANNQSWTDVNLDAAHDELDVIGTGTTPC